MKPKTIFRHTASLVGLLTATIASNSASAEFLVGQGRYDITGPAAELGMAGYGNLEQSTTGIHMRQYARSFIIADSDSNQRVVLVVNDTVMTTNSITEAVVEQLQQRYGDIYRLDNVLINSQHTHAGPGGFSYYTLYSITAIGFNQQNFDAIVDGTVNSIIRAHENLQPGRVEINRGTIHQAGANRSVVAYNENPNEELNQYNSDMNQEMVQLKFVAGDRDIGVYNWFGVHGTSMTQENRLISGDNKGYAALRFEEWKNAGSENSASFVAAFAQSEGGDISPNISPNGEVLSPSGIGPTNDEFENTRIIGERQFEGARSIYQSTREVLSGPIRIRHQFIDLQAQLVRDEFTGEGPQSLCIGSLGYAFAAGAEDGPGPSFFQEGQLRGNLFINALTGGLARVDNALRRCQAPKPILIATGNANPHPWTPNILPISVVTIGDLAIVAIPAEISTMAGRRLKATVENALNGQANHIVISALTNHYSGYITTKEEYGSQQYEGGHTLFGQWTLAAYQQAFSALAKALVEGRAVSTLTPPDLSNDLVNFQAGVARDLPPRRRAFGDVDTDVASQYNRGDTVHASFWTGHPKNNLRTEQSYCYFQKLENNQWVTVADDSQYETRYRWERVNGFRGTSLAHCSWTIPDNAESGEYRIFHQASYKRLIGRRTYPLEGTSSTFVLP